MAHRTLPRRGSATVEVSGSLPVRLRNVRGRSRGLAPEFSNASGLTPVGGMSDVAAIACIEMECLAAVGAMH
jgi:hypothetical protein